ncbi:MAG TPA: sigma 54-interacting transcriptional regulator [Candidatus Binatia bacterium]|nr:sigma 54-interacting transcriptional regulator [Candidatus Binatia bacterium]
MAREGVDILCVTLGFADVRERGRSDHEAALDRSVSQINEIQAAAGKAYLMVFGGPVLLPQDAALIYQRTGAQGYIGGSAIERIPVAAVITQTVRDFKQTTLAGRREDRLGSMIGTSRSMQEVFESIRRVARSDAPVLLVGESGTGKELAAREIHRLSGRSDHPMVSWNCGATTEGLAQSELFGHERGAFSGATRSHVGRFESAHGGTLFMDEVADLPLAVQASLLRVLQEGEIVPVGGEKTLHVDVRLIAATNRDYSAGIAGGRFRLDLYYRLSTVLLRIPPLRERREDIPALVRELCQEFARQYECPAPPISTPAMDRLVGHSWPGNIRQLRNVIERLFILGPSTGWLDEMFEMDRAFEPQRALPSSRAARRKRLREVLARHDGNKTRAARELGVTRKTLYSWLQ